jgi:hypothetical protein
MSSLPQAKKLADQEAQKRQLSQEEQVRTAIEANRKGQVQDEVEIELPPIRCLGEWVAVIPIQQSDETEGGLYTGASGTDPTVGICVGAGPECTKYIDDSLMGRLIGQTVKYSGRAAVALDADDCPSHSDYIINLLSIRNIICTLPEKAKVKLCPDTTTSATPAAPS